MSDPALRLLETELREAVRHREVDPARGGARQLRDLVEQVLDDYEDRVCTSSLPKVKSREEAARRLVEGVAGFGPLQPLMEDPEIEEIWINGPGKVFCSRHGDRVLTNVILDDAGVKDLVERMLRSSGRRLDLSSPFVDATLQDGSRLHVVIPDITRRHWSVNIRKFVVKAHRLQDLIGLGSLTAEAALFLDGAVRAGLNIVVSGGTQTGKTTLLNCLASAIPARERVVTCEEVFELQLTLPDVVAMQTRQQNLEGQGAIPLRRLIVEALRMRPDRLIVGEVREREALDLLIALNSGMPGMASLHANSAADAILKLTTLPLLAGDNVTHAFVVPTVAGSVDLVVHLALDRGRRLTTEIVALSGRVEGTQIEAVPIFDSRSGRLRWAGNHPPQAKRFTSAGVDLTEALR